MRVATFYFSMVPAIGRQQITLPNGERAFIRVEVKEVRSQDPLGLALDKATPMADEHVMNTHEVASA